MFLSQMTFYHRWKISCCHCSYFRVCITRILDKLTKAEFERGPERSLGLEKKKRKKKGAVQKYETVDEKKHTAKEYMVTNNRNWGKMSAMMLATRTYDRHIIAHDMCWRIIRKVWRYGNISEPKVCALFVHFITLLTASCAYYSSCLLFSGCNVFKCRW